MQSVPSVASRVAAAGVYAPRRPAATVSLALAGTEGAAASPSVERAFVAAEAACAGYPDAAPLRADLALRHGISADQVLVTAGADEALERAFRAYLEPGHNALLTTPTFEMLPRFASMCDATATSVAWPDGPFPRAAMIGAITPRTTLVAVVTPNNPTGSVATFDDLKALHDAAPHAVIVVDLAYVEYGDVDPTSELLRLPRAIVTRTFSKAWGLAGARVGYALGSAASIRALAAAGNPYPIAAPSLALVRDALAHGEAAMLERVSAVRTRRAQLLAAFAAADIPVAPTQANFVCAQPRDARWLWDALVGSDIGTRLIEDPTPTRVRMTVPPDEAGCTRVAAALMTYARPQALLLDMDGVLADVSQSYRAAIVGAAASFGVVVTPAQIAAAKQRGNANDDWQVTAALIAAERPDVTYDAARAAFEAIYQGTAASSGLWERELPIAARAALRRLSTRLPLAIVTGRPRHDAERFLDAHGLTDCFATLVAREDGPIKPDPFVVHEALRRLGVTRAWMVGDTPDDIRAARAADVLPLGVLAPGDDARMHDALMAAGAARVLTTLDELETLLP